MSTRHPTTRDRLRLHESEPHHHPPPPPPQELNGTVSPAVAPSALTPLQKLAAANEQTWLLIGQVAEQMGDLDHGLTAYENALRHNPVSLPGLTQVAAIARIKENYPKAVEYFQRALNLQEDNGEVWSALGHCYLMQDDLQKAYSAYQQALYLLPNPKEDPKLWYGIGILYDRYGSLDHAEEAFSSVLRMERELDFDKVNEILFRLGIIYKQQLKYDESLRCFERILRNPPSPLAHADIWFQIGHVYEQMKDPIQAKHAYERVISDNPTHAKVLQQLGWLHHQDESPFQNQDVAIQYLTQSLEADPSDAQSWYLLGRAYMAGQKYNKAYEAYQQAVYRDGRNPTFWCSIGVLYFQINQFRDALDAYSRAIRINPYISEVWFDLGSLYESCNNQISDAIDAYARASELDRNNMVVLERLELLKKAQATGAQIPAAPGPQDVHPTAYANAVVAPPGLSGPPLLLQSSNSRNPYGDPRGPGHEGSMAPPQGHSGRTPPAPFRGGPPPPVVLDESRSTNHAVLAPMEVDRPPHMAREHLPPPPPRDSASRGPLGQNILLRHPSPRERSPSVSETRASIHNESYFTRTSRPASTVTSSPTHARARSPPPFQNYPPSRQANPLPPPQHSPRVIPSRDVRRESEWERRQPPPPPPNDHREWERRGPAFTRSPPDVRMQSPAEPSPRSSHASARQYWDPKPLPPTGSLPPHPHRQPSPTSEPPKTRYDPRFDQREEMDHKGLYAPLARTGVAPSQYPQPPRGTSNESNSRAPTPAGSESSRRRRSQKGGPMPSSAPVTTIPPPPTPPKEELTPGDRRSNGRRRQQKRSRDEGDGRSETPKPYPSLPPPGMDGPPGPRQGRPSGVYRTGSPDAMSSGSSSKPSPTGAMPPSRIVDEDYDEGVAETLMGLKYRVPPESSNLANPQPVRQVLSHRGSLSSSSAGHASPPTPAALKRPSSPGADDLSDAKRQRMDNANSVPATGNTPTISTRPSPIPFRTQPTSRSPEMSTSPPLPSLPPHPRPVGVTGLSSGAPPSASQALPPIATLSPESAAASPDNRRQDSRSPPNIKSRPEEGPRSPTRASPASP